MKTTLKAKFKFYHGFGRGWGSVCIKTFVNFYVLAQWIRFRRHNCTFSFLAMYEVIWTNWHLCLTVPFLEKILILVGGGGTRLWIFIEFKHVKIIVFCPAIRQHNTFTSIFYVKSQLLSNECNKWTSHHIDIDSGKLAKVLENTN